MDIVTCIRCNVGKPPNQFYKDKNREEGIRRECKECSKKSVNKYYNKNKEKIKEKQRKYHHDNKEKRNEKSRQYRAKNIEKMIETSRQYYADNREELLIKKKEYRKNNIEKEREADKKYYWKNKEKKTKYNKQYYKENKEKINKKDWETKKKRLKIDPVYKLRCRLKDLIVASIKRKGFSKKTKTANILGCSWEELKNHLEDNPYGFKITDKNLDIDHIIPINSAKTEDIVYKLNHYKNLQLLPSYYNRHIKSDKPFDKEDLEEWLKSFETQHKKIFKIAKTKENLYN